jgi:hypothetical protein
VWKVYLLQKGNPRSLAHRDRSCRPFSDTIER